MTTQSEGALENNKNQPQVPNYYWLGGLILAEGSIVLPGNWVRIVDLTPGHQLALRESIYESVRKEAFPDLPSRSTSSFICEGEEVIRKFQTRNNWTTAILYEVEIINNTAKRYSLDSELLGVQKMEEGGRLLSVEELREKAKLYWSSADQANIEIPEIVVESPLKIIKRIG